MVLRLSSFFDGRVFTHGFFFLFHEELFISLALVLLSPPPFFVFHWQESDAKSVPTWFFLMDYPDQCSALRAAAMIFWGLFCKDGFLDAPLAGGL